MAVDRWMRLATYNAEVHRGIVHTPEYDTEMFREQQAFDAEHRAADFDQELADAGPLDEEWR